MAEREDQLIQATSDLTKMVGEVLEKNIKLEDRVKVVEERSAKIERALGKLILEFGGHSHNGLGQAVIPVS